MDTGAQANLIRKVLVSDHLLEDAPERLCLRMANGQRLEGGERIASLTLGFRQILRGEVVPQLSWHEATFFEADIRVDAILSYPWLVENGLGVFPHLKALSAVESKFSLRLGMPQQRKKSRYW